MGVTVVLEILQASFLEDMLTRCAEGHALESTWAADEEVTTTEELEARLRSHRWPHHVKQCMLTCIVAAPATWSRQCTASAAGLTVLQRRS